MSKTYSKRLVVDRLINDYKIIYRSNELLGEVVVKGEVQEVYVPYGNYFLVDKIRELKGGKLAVTLQPCGSSRGRFKVRKELFGRAEVQIYCHTEEVLSTTGQLIGVRPVYEYDVLSGTVMDVSSHLLRTARSLQLQCRGDKDLLDYYIRLYTSHHFGERIHEAVIWVMQSAVTKTDQQKAVDYFLEEFFKCTSAYKVIKQTDLDFDGRKEDAKVG